MQKQTDNHKQTIYRHIFELKNGKHAFENKCSKRNKHLICRRSSAVLAVAQPILGLQE